MIEVNTDTLLEINVDIALLVFHSIFKE